LNPAEVVAYVESEMSQYRPCPMCGQYGSLESHQAGCLYLTYKGMSSAPEENTDGGGSTTTSESANADVVSADETSSPVSDPKEATDTATTTEIESPAAE
jgi:hypothetical protein